jgi:GNAT superfamily N-acetyltransferase
MKVYETKDLALIDSLTEGTGCPPAKDYLREGWHVVVAEDEGRAIAGILVLEAGLLELPEVHLAVPPAERGKGTFRAIAAFKEWLADNTVWNSIWTFIEDERMAKFAKRVGFVEAFTHGNKAWMFLPIRRVF